MQNDFVDNLRERDRDTAAGEKIEVAEELAVEDQVWVKVMTVDVEQQRIGLRCRSDIPPLTHMHPTAARPAHALLLRQRRLLLLLLLLFPPAMCALRKSVRWMAAVSAPFGGSIGCLILEMPRCGKGHVHIGERAMIAVPPVKFQLG